MRDLVALSTLPAVWAGLGPVGIAGSLADVLFSTLSLDLLYVRLRGVVDERVIEVVRTRHDSDGLHDETIRKSLDHILNLNPDVDEPASTIPNPFGDGTLHLAITRFGIADDAGILIVGSTDAEFPSERDRLLLGVGANQTTIVIQRLAAESKAGEQAERLRTTLASIADAVITTDTDGRCTNLNGVAEILTGWTNEDAVGQPLDVVFDITSETTRQTVANPATKALQGGVICVLADHTILTAKTCSERLIDGSAAAIRSKDGKIVGCVLVFRDVTEKHLTKLSLQASEERFRATFENAGVGISHLSPDGKWLRANQRFCEIVGHPLDQLVHKTFHEISHPDDLAVDVAQMNKLLSGELSNFSMEKRYVRFHGEIAWTRMTVSLLRDSAGEPLHFISVVEDITDKKKYELELIDSEAHVRRVIDNTTNFIAVFDSDGTFVDVNEAALQATGLTRVKLLGQKFWDVGCWSYNRNVAAGVKAALTQSIRGTQVRLDSDYLAADGTVRVVDLSLSPVHDHEGGILYVIGCGIDITERKAAEDALRESQRNLQFIAELHVEFNPLASSDTIANLGCRRITDFLNLTRCLLWICDVHADTARVTHEYRTKDMPDGIGEYRLSDYFNDRQIQQLQAGAAVVKLDVQSDAEAATKAEGFAELKVASTVAMPYVTDGRLQLMLSVCKDTPYEWKPAELALLKELAMVIYLRVQRAHAEEELAEAKQLLDLTISLNNVAIWSWDTVLDELVVDDSLKRMFGITLDSPASCNDFKARIAEADRKRVCDSFHKLLEFGGTFHEDYEVRLPDGVSRFYQGRGTLTIAPDATKTCTGVVLDVTQLKQAQMALAESERRFRDMANTAPAMIWVTDEQHCCTFLSQSWFDFTGQTEKEGLGSGWIDAVHPDDRKTTDDLFRAATDQREAFELDYRLRTADGSFRWAINAGRPRSDSNGRFIGFVGSVIDAHDRHEAQAALQEAREAAEAANASKSAFLANMSHEIRTPMTAILGYTELVSDIIDKPEALAHLQTIRRNGDFLLDIISDILDLSKIEADKLDIVRQHFDPLQLVEDVRSIMAVRGAEKGLDLKVEYRGKLPVVIDSDPKRLKQILINLVGNAIKFTKAGRVQLIVSFADEKFRFDVIDTGIGMSKVQQKRLFQPFTQGDYTVNREFGGTGLGLAISQRLALMLGGSIDVESIVGEGSTFSVTIAVGDITGVALVEPELISDPVNQDVAPAEIALDCHVLVVDDRRDVRFLSKRFLMEAGATVNEAEDGELAVDAVKESIANGNTFDIIILDMQMPRLDGYQTARVLRQLGYAGPIIALTADAMHGDMTRCIECGCNDYLSKPIDRAILLTKVKGFVHATAD